MSLMSTLLDRVVDAADKRNLEVISKVLSMDSTLLVTSDVWPECAHWILIDWLDMNCDALAILNSIPQVTYLTTTEQQKQIQQASQVIIPCRLCQRCLIENLKPNSGSCEYGLREERLRDIVRLVNSKADYTYIKKSYKITPNAYNNKHTIEYWVHLFGFIGELGSLWNEMKYLQHELRQNHNQYKKCESTCNVCRFASRKYRNGIMEACNFHLKKAELQEKEDKWLKRTGDIDLPRPKHITNFAQEVLDTQPCLVCDDCREIVSRYNTELFTEEGFVVPFDVYLAKTIVLKGRPFV